MPRLPLRKKCWSHTFSEPFVSKLTHFLEHFLSQNGLIFGHLEGTKKRNGMACNSVILVNSGILQNHSVYKNKNIILLLRAQREIFEIRTFSWQISFEKSILIIDFPLQRINPQKLPRADFFWVPKLRIHEGKKIIFFLGTYCKKKTLIRHVAWKTVTYNV